MNKATSRRLKMEDESDEELKELHDPESVLEELQELNKESGSLARGRPKVPLEWTRVISFA